MIRVMLVDDHPLVLEGLRAMMDAERDIQVVATTTEGERAAAWGRAIRLAQRLSGGTETLLRKSRVELGERKLTLTISPRFRHLYADAVERRLKGLANALGREPAVKFG